MCLNAKEIAEDMDVTVTGSLSAGEEANASIRLLNGQAMHQSPQLAPQWQAPRLVLIAPPDHQTLASNYEKYPRHEGSSRLVSRSLLVQKELLSQAGFSPDLLRVCRRGSQTDFTASHPQSRPAPDGGFASASRLVKG